MDENEAFVHKVNLIEIVLSAEYPDVPEPPEVLVRSWTEEQLRAYYKAGIPQPSPATPSGVTSVPSTDSQILWTGSYRLHE